MGPSDTFILTVLTSAQALTAAEAQSVVGWWMAERLADESLLAFLVRREVFGSEAADLDRSVGNDPLASLEASKLFAKRGVARLRKNLGLSQRLPNPSDLVHCLARRTPRRNDLDDLRPASGRPTDRQAVPTVRAGTLLGKYLLVEQIGRGASCIVFRGLHRGLNIPVAVKVLPHESDPDDPTVRELFRAEARLQARLDHPNIVRVLDFEGEAALPYIVLEYVEGMTLAERIAKGGRLSADQALKMVLQISEALAAIHKMGIVHRDVKPGNILLTADGHKAKLADLGLALVVGTALHRRPAPASATPWSARRPTCLRNRPYPLQERSTTRARHLFARDDAVPHTHRASVAVRRSRLEVMLKHTQEKPVSPDQLVPELLGPGNRRGWS